jgi:hypothetical protein
VNQVPLNAQVLPQFLPPANGADAEQHRTFAQFFNDELKDPCRRQYTRMMERFDAAGVGAPNSDSLLRQVVNQVDTTAQAYFLSSYTSQGPRIFCVHLPRIYCSALDGTPTRWDDKSFAFLGEVLQGLISIVEFPTNAFETVTLQARTADYILQHLDDLDPVFPPAQPDPADATLQEVTTRRMMYLPAVYVPLFLSAAGYSIRQVWELLIPALTQRHEMEVCEPLVAWLRAASMASVSARPLHIGPPAVCVPLISPPADEHLLEQRNQILNSALPALRSPPQKLENALSQMAVALIAQTNDNRAARDQRAMQEAEPKLPSERFTVTLPVLLDILQLASEIELPPLWHRWANCTKRQEVQVLQDSLDAYARSADAFSPAIPIVTIRLVQDLLAFKFMGQSADDIKVGLHPFIITDGNAEFRQTNAEVARIYGLLNAGEATCSLSDLELLQAKEVRSVPVTYWELEKSLGMFGNLLGVVVGTNHPLTLAFREFWLLLQTNVKDDLHATLDYKGYVKPTHILRSIQLICYTWFIHRRAHLNPPNPDMKVIVQQILMQIYVLPHLPPQLYQLAYPKKGPVTLTLSGSLGSTASLTTATPHSTSTASVVSGLTNPTLTPPPTRAAIINTQPIAPLQALLPANIKLKDLIGNVPPPQFDGGGEMCLSYLLRNTCWTNCKRAGGHRASLTPSEHQRLVDYVTTQKQSYQARRPAPTSVVTGALGTVISPVTGGPGTGLPP